MNRFREERILAKMALAILVVGGLALGDWVGVW
jgi:hypothetical protein